MMKKTLCDYVRKGLHVLFFIKSPQKKQHHLPSRESNFLKLFVLRHDSVCPLNDHMVTSLQGEKVPRVSGWNTLVTQLICAAPEVHSANAYESILHSLVEITLQKNHVCYKGRRLFHDCAILRHLTNFTWNIVSSEGPSFSSFGEPIVKIHC